MWFGKSSRKRHFERSEVLEVRSRSEPVRRERRRLVIWALIVALSTFGIVVGVSYGWSWGRQKVLDAGLFALKTVEITIDGNWVTAEQVRRWVGIREGMNLLAIDLPRVRRDLELVPQVRSASVERVLPHLLRVRVVEREPVARVQTLAVRSEGGFTPATYYLDEMGVVMPAPQPGEVSADFLQTLETLPLIRGVAQRDLCPGRKVGSASVESALRLLGCFGRFEMAREVEVRVIDVSTPGLMSVMTDEGAILTLSHTGLEEQLRRWALVRDACMRAGKTISSLDLSITNNCPLRWAEASNSLPVRARPAKHSGRPNKHV
jgi:hypothetical protein